MDASLLGSVEFPWLSCIEKQGHGGLLVSTDLNGDSSHPEDNFWGGTGGWVGPLAGLGRGGRILGRGGGGVILGRGGGGDPRAMHDH